jgi:hypothetical protein
MPHRFNYTYPSAAQVPATDFVAIPSQALIWGTA